MVLFGVLFLGCVWWLDLEPWYVTDQAGILSAETEQLLSQKLSELRKENGAEFVVVTIDDLAWRDPFEVAYNLAQFETDSPDPNKHYKDWATWVWDKERDNGLLLLVAPNDRKRYAVTGRWLEGPLPDVYVKRLWEWVLVPAFREWDYDWGVSRFFDIAAWVIRGEYENKPFDSNTQQWNWVDLLILWIFLSFFFGWALKPSLKTDEQKYWWSGIASSLYAWLAAFGIWWSALFMIVPLFLIWLLVLFGENKGWVSYWGWWFSGWWSFGGWFGGFGWWSFGGGWAWWWR